jgi:deazaflavin-dependent oxidoreductase (nitroreductase family)
MDNLDEELLRLIFKGFNRFMILIWRLGLGSWGNNTKWGGSIMVIKHFGRKSGKAYLTPVNYAVIDGNIYCTAGFGSKSDWYKNLLANPVVEVWLPNGRWAGTAQDITTSDPNRVVVFRQVLIASGFAGPLFGENPARLSDDDLDKLLENYRLIRIYRSAALTGPGGPGDLAWIWSLTTFLFLGKLLHGWKRNRKP